MARLCLPGRVRKSAVVVQGRIDVQTQPSPTATTAVALAQQPVFRVLTNAGTVQTNYTGPVTVSKTGTPALSGTLTRNAVAGIATFTDLVLTGAGAVTLTASTPSRSPITTTSITVT